jgi:hypothetical protein
MVYRHGMKHLIALALLATVTAPQHQHPVMGFDLDQTTHHFALTASGGRITVTVNDAANRTDLDAIRMHLRHIAAEFAEGRFDAPLSTHGAEPDGVPALRARRAAIAYRYHDVNGGGAVEIATKDAVALAAIHDFLRYQIREHKTGDPLTIQQ